MRLGNVISTLAILVSARSGMSMAAEAAARFFVAGKVQGVFFRASTREQAQRRNLRGHAVNLADGRVEVLAVGDALAIDSLAHWLQQGPPMARVDRVQRESADGAQVGSGFDIG